MGKYLLNSRGVECKWQPTDNTKPVAMIKKRLAGNQIIIAYMLKVKAFDSYVTKPAIKAYKVAGRIFDTIKGNALLPPSSKAKHSMHKKIIGKKISTRDTVVRFFKK